MAGDGGDSVAAGGGEAKDDFSLSLLLAAEIEGGREGGREREQKERYVRWWVYHYALSNITVVGGN